MVYQITLNDAKEQVYYFQDAVVDCDYVIDERIHPIKKRTYLGIMFEGK